MAPSSTLIDALKDRGIRITPQRAIILNTIEEMPGHMTVEGIYARVQRINSYINLATVYRTLELLRELELVTEADMGTGATHFALHTHATHHHAICRSCGHSIEFPHDLLTPLIESLRTGYHFVADANHTVLFGWCEGCVQDDTKSNR